MVNDNNISVYIQTNVWEKFMKRLEVYDYDVTDRYTFNKYDLYDSIECNNIYPDIVITDNKDYYKNISCLLLDMSKGRKYVRNKMRSLISEHISDIFISLNAQAKGNGLLQGLYMENIYRNNISDKRVYNMDVFNDFVASDNLYKLINYYRKNNVMVNILEPNKEFINNNICADIIYQNIKVLKTEFVYIKNVKFVEV